MFFFTFLARPKADNAKRYDYGGAFVNCWVNTADQLEAETLARENIDRCGWHVEGRETSCRVTRDHCHESQDGLKHFHQAEHDGSCFIFETWSVEAEEAED